MTEFEKKVLNGLNLCGINPEDSNQINQKNPLGVAVSGGADSVSLLVSLSRVLEFFGKKNCLEAITVNHGIREKSETDDDALFVENLCGALGVHCEKITFENGKIAEESKQNGKGIEETARAFRYEAFENFITEKNLRALCLAHNQNDQAETVLMRLFAGSGSEGLGGIPRTRGKIIRPLLEISRAEIESYLKENQISWRTDKTNFDNHYSRNKIRNVLVPFLNENFSGWKNSVLVSARKAADDNFFIQKTADEILAGSTHFVTDKNKKTAEIDGKIFFDAESALQRRIIFSVLNKIGFGGRFPFKLVEEISGWKKIYIEAGKKEKNHFAKSLSFESLKIILENGKFKFENQDKNDEKKEISKGYSFVFFDKNDSFEYEKIRFTIEEIDEKFFLSARKIDDKSGCAALRIPVESFPFFVGSAMSGEKIRASDGKSKKISDIFSDWKVPESERNSIPVVRNLEGGIESCAVLGSLFGFPDWKVKSSKSDF